MSSNKVTCLLQDSRGYLWIGTEDGLNRYDGNRITVYRHGIEQVHSISDNFVQVICESSTGDIWVGTRYGGISIWNRQTEQFEHIQRVANDPNSLPENEVCGLLEAGNGDMWVKTRSYIAKLSSDDKQIKAFGHYSNVFKSDFAYNYPLYPLDNDKILLGTKDGLNLFDPAGSLFVRIRMGNEPSEVFQEAVTDIVAMGDRILVASDKGLHWYDPHEHVLLPFPSNGQTQLVGQIKLFNADNDHVWVGCGSGIIKLDKNGNSQTHLVKFSMGGITDRVTDLIEDKSGIVWVGTQFNGLFKIDSHPSRFQSIDASVLGLSPKGSLNVTSLLYYAPNQMWLGVQGKGLLVYDRKTGRVQIMEVQKEKGSQPIDVTALFADHNSDVWIGTNQGIFKYLAGKKQIVAFNYGDNKEFATLLQENDVRSIAEDQDHNIWIATNFGLYKYNGKSIESFFSDPDYPNTLSHDEVNCLLVDSDNVLWVGTRKGLDRVSQSGRKIERMIHSNPQMNALLNDFILSMAQDEKGDIWIGTRKGLARLNKATRNFKIYSAADGLVNDVVNGILCDHLNRVWISTNFGISCVIDNLVVNFTIDDGLSGYAFNPGAVHCNLNGELFFGGFGGVSYLAPGVIELNKKIPGVVIQGARVYSRGELKSQHQGELRELSFKYLKNSTLEVDFAALEFTQPHQNRYRIMLDGFDERWSAPTSKNSAIFSNLPPGDYTLKVMASNNDLVWNNTPAILKISISPPLYLSTYAIVFYFIAVFVLFHGVVNYRIRSYRKAYKNLQEKAEDKTKLELQKEALARTHKSLTDSINYAKRIQERMLFSEDAVKRLLPESFIYYRPKDIVSGDFYYFYARENKLIVAEVDCTGHGVPGAFMSIIGYDLLRNIVEMQRVDCPATILDMMNEQLSGTFLKENAGHSSSYEMRDGMDLSICVIDYNKKMAEFAGANSSIYLVRENELIVFDGNRSSIGFSGTQLKYTKRQFPITENDVMYMFSDGYTDQFGGPDGKKFKYRRFRHLLLNIHKLPMEDQKAILHQKMEEWMGEEYWQIDDILLIGFRPITSQLV
ncbi:MAG: two-component regulator propeller domain-containing protein [Breznakibacter sp.]